MHYSLNGFETKVLDLEVTQYQTIDSIFKLNISYAWQRIRDIDTFNGGKTSTVQLR